MKKTPGWMLALWISIVVIAAVAFIFKMTEFALTMTGQESAEFGGFGATALGGYFLGMIPLLFLTLWGVFHGHFRNIEQPKHRMLEMQDEIEQFGNRVPHE